VLEHTFMQTIESMRSALRSARSASERERKRRHAHVRLVFEAAAQLAQVVRLDVGGHDRSRSAK
jgi:hypothetical protein